LSAGDGLLKECVELHNDLGEVTVSGCNPFMLVQLAELCFIAYRAYQLTEVKYVVFLMSSECLIYFTVHRIDFMPISPPFAVK